MVILMELLSKLIFEHRITSFLEANIHYLAMSEEIRNYGIKIV